MAGEVVDGDGKPLRLTRNICRWNFPSYRAVLSNHDGWLVKIEYWRPKTIMDRGRWLRQREFKIPLSTDDAINLLNGNRDPDDEVMVRYSDYFEQRGWT